MDAASLVTLGIGAVVVLLVLATGLVAVLRSRRRVERRLTASLADVESLRERVDDLSRQLGPGGPSDPEPDPPRGFVITSLPDAPAARTLAVPDESGATSLSAGQFTTVALSESLVRVVALGYGVRWALSAESRNRIRFAMRQEVRRSRRQRRRDLKEAKRQLRTRPAGLTEDAA